MNIIILLSDALRASALGCYGNSKNLSPNIDEIARNGVCFSNVFSTVNSTDSSLTTIFTGKYPASHGILHQGSQITEQEKRFTKKLVFLPEVLQQKDYVTISIDWLGKWHKRGYSYYCGDEDKKTSRPHRHLQKIIEILFKVSSLSKKRHKRYASYYYLGPILRKRIRDLCKYSKIDNRIPMSSDADALTDIAIDHIDRFGSTGKMFMFVHYWDTHGPYTAPYSIVRELKKKVDYPRDSIRPVLDLFRGTNSERIIKMSIRGKTPRNIGQILAHYDASVKYVDNNIGRIYNFLKHKNLLSDTLILFTADHGESLTENGIYFHHHGLYDPQIRVPLILSAPSIPNGKVYSQFVQHFDIMPTILDLLNIDDGDYKFDGMSLLKLINGEKWDRRYVFVEEACTQRKRMIRDTQYKYIQSLKDSKCEFCQKYHSKEDEFLAVNDELKDSDKIVCDDSLATEYKDKLEEYIQSLDAPQEEGEIAFEDEDEINERLKALGYL